LTSLLSSTMVQNQRDRDGSSTGQKKNLLPPVAVHDVGGEKRKVLPDRTRKGPKQGREGLKLKQRRKLETYAYGYASRKKKRLIRLSPVKGGP